MTSSPLDKSLLAFALLHFILKAKLGCYSGYHLTSYFCIPIPYDDKDSFFLLLLLLLALECIVVLHRTDQL